MPDPSRGAFFRIDKTRVERCLAPGLVCDQPPIRAHSIQNSRFLSLLEREGHVVQLARRMGTSGPEVQFCTVGRNKASTFTGLCAEHDREIFEPIEDTPIDVANPRHLFLLAYRAVLHETHSTAEAGIKAQAVYQQRVEDGRDSRDSLSPAGMHATQRLILAYETYVLKEEFDAAYVASDYSAFDHDVVDFRVSAASIASSALFSLDGVVVDGQVVRVCHSILPLTPIRSVAVYSYRQQEAGSARAQLSRILTGQGDHQLYEISRRLLNSCENFVISPAVFDSWPQDKKDAIQAFFVRTIFRDALEVEDQHLMLFERGT